MGYDLTRFVGEVDDEFQCSICTMVLQDPVQAPCEHSFCNDCIKQWLAIDTSCPVDRKPLMISDIKPASRPFRKLWSKLEIKCDFQAQGCASIVQLQNLKRHVDSCEYNLDSEIVCDKGCGMTITRGEYKINNCFSHLANRVVAQEMEDLKLKHDLSDQKEHCERIGNSLQDEIRTANAKLSHELSVQKKLSEGVAKGLQEIRKLVDTMNRKKSERNLSPSMSEQEQQIAEFNKLNIQLRPLKWKLCENVLIEESNILKLGDPSKLYGYVISDCPLKPNKSYLKVHMLENYTGASIGLFSNVRACEIRYLSLGCIYEKRIRVGQILPNWKMGDIIECGIKFPEVFMDDGSHWATVYFSKNQAVCYETNLQIPKGSFLPQIELFDKRSRLQYFQQS